MRLAIGIALLASAVVGFETGWLTGHTGPDATVLAAVLPAILGAVAGGVGVVAAGVTSTNGEKEAGAGWDQLLIVALIAIAFSVALHVGVGLGTEKLKDERAVSREDALDIALIERTARIQAEQREASERVKAVYGYLERCEAVWMEVNEFRRKVNMEPVAIGQTCIAVPGVGSGQAAEAFVGGVVDALVSEEALKLHQAYLRACSVRQIREINEAVKARKAQPRIGDVCPALLQDGLAEQ